MSARRHSPSVTSRRFVDSTARPLLERWRDAKTEAEQLEALEAFGKALSDEGARRRADLEDEIERKDHALAERAQEVELLQARIGVLQRENERLRNALGGSKR